MELVKSRRKTRLMCDALDLRVTKGQKGHCIACLSSHVLRGRKRDKLHLNRFLRWRDKHDLYLSDKAFNRLHMHVCIVSKFCLFEVEKIFSHELKRRAKKSVT